MTDKQEPIRAIVPGHNPITGKATLRAVTLPAHIKGDNPVTAKAAAVIMNADDEFRPSMVAKNAILPSDMPELFEELWDALTLKKEQKRINIVVITSPDGLLGEIQVEDLPSGWAYDTEYHEDEKAAIRAEEERESLEALDGDYDDRFEYDDDFAVDRG